MSLWGRLGPGVQGLPALFIAAAESNLCPMDAPQSLDREPLTILWKGWGRRPGAVARSCPGGPPAASALGDNLIIAATERAGDSPLPTISEEAPQPSRLQTGTKAWACK